ncbi:MAG: hypothetical protein ABW250_04395, partial [Pyrinomonadaceae bacterium]
MEIVISTETVVRKLIGAATSEAPPVVGSIINFILDELIFPKKEVDIWAQVEGRVTELVRREISDALAKDAFARVGARLSGLGNAFRQYALVVDQNERQIRLGYLLMQAEIVTAEVATVPDKYLPRVVEPLQLVMVTHVAALLDQVKMYPDRYENQMALNTTAIRYSDLAGSLYRRFWEFRMGKIAEGKGTLVMTEETRLTIGKPEKKVQFKAYDKFSQWQTNPEGYEAGSFLVSVYSPWVPKDFESREFYDAQENARRLIGEYGKKEAQAVDDWWTEHLTRYTGDEGFMRLVDWEGIKIGRKPKDRTAVRAFPLLPGKNVAELASVPDKIDLFLCQQMDQFMTSGPRYVQTYRLPGSPRLGEQANIFYRADTYDTAMAAIYMQLRGDLGRATDLVDGLCTALEHDPVGGGRIVAATKATSLLDPSGNYTTSVYYPDGGTRDIGNMCWAGIALTRLYAQNRRYRYLHNSLLIADWLLTNCYVMDDRFGFSGGEDQWGNKRKWRSVEHNVDAYAFFRNLHVLTEDPRFKEAAEHARKLVISCLVHDGYYVTGTGEGDSLNSGVVPTDTQSWTALAGLNPDANARSLQFMLDRLSTQTVGYSGFKFALNGSGIQCEATAGAVMAMFLQGGQLRDKAQSYYQSLEAIIKRAKSGDGLGVVATPGDEADTGPGLGWKYFNWLHVASSAWT